MVAPLIPVVVITAGMTLRSDTKPMKVFVKRPRGTLYWGGAGLNGIYLEDQLKAFQEAGIQHIYRGTNTTGSEKTDALWSGTSLRYEDTDEWVISKGLDTPAPQFNLIGYSYGSLLAAQTANFYANQGHIVDHLVLIGSPVDRDFLAKLKSHRNVKKLIILNLTQHGDPIYAGMTQMELLKAVSVLADQDEKSGKTKGIGHFYYRPASEEGRTRRRDLSKYLFQQGLR
jgi:pimeloyl-ACP methyl ester carboxylesterase